MIISAYQLEILRIFLEAQTGSRSRNPEEITSKCLLFRNSCYNSFPFCQFSIATKNDCMKNDRLMNDRSLEKIKKNTTWLSIPVINYQRVWVVCNISMRICSPSSQISKNLVHHKSDPTTYYGSSCMQPGYQIAQWRLTYGTPWGVW